jgi:hypothetical protein
MGASLTMIDPHYGHLARDGREHAIHLDSGSAVGSDRAQAGWLTTILRAAVSGNVRERIAAAQREPGASLYEGNRLCEAADVVGSEFQGRALALLKIPEITQELCDEALRVRSLRSCLSAMRGLDNRPSLIEGPTGALER